MHGAGVSCADLGYSLALAQLQRTGQAASKGPWASVGGGKGGSGQELRQLASANTNTCGAKTDEICRASTAAVLAIGLSGESFWDCPHNT